jgi:hypothetical protein
VSNFFIVGSVGQQQLFVVAKKLCRIREALIPQKHQPTAGLQDANEFAPRPLAVEPVSGLRCGDKVHAVMSQSGCLGCPCNAGELRKPNQQPFGRFAHLGIGLDTENWVTILQQGASPNAGSGGDVSHQVSGREAAFGFQGRATLPADIRAGIARSFLRDRKNGSWHWRRAWSFRLSILIRGSGMLSCPPDSLGLKPRRFREAIFLQQGEILWRAECDTIPT